MNRYCVIALLFAVRLWAQPTLPNAVPSPWPVMQFLNESGQPLVGAKLCTYQANSSTPLATYTSSTAGTPNTNPVVLDVAGRAAVWIGPRAYKFVLRNGGDSTCNTGSVIWTQDNILDASLYLANYVKTVGTSTLLTYVCSDVNCVERTVSNKFNEDLLTIRDFGALGDGSADDTTAIQNALDYAASVHQILVVPGTPDFYKTTDTLNVPAGSTVTGWADNSAAPLITYTGADTSKDIINVGNAGAGAIVFRVYLHGFSIDATVGAANGVHLHRASEGIIDIQVGNATHPGVIGTGLFCDQCFVWELKPVITSTVTGVKFDTAGPFGVGTIDLHDANIFETTTAIQISWGSQIFIKNNQIENFTVGIQFDNDCTIAGTGCVIDGIRILDNTISVSGASGHDSPVGMFTNMITSKHLLVTQLDMRGNQLTAIKNGGGATPYVIDLDVGAGVVDSGVFMTLSGNNIEGGTTTSIHVLGDATVVSDQGGNNYRLTHIGSNRPIADIFSGTARFVRWDYRQYIVSNPELGADTLLTIKANPSQFGVAHPVINGVGHDGNSDWQYYDRTGFSFRADAAFEWEKYFGARDPSDDAIYGFGSYGAAGAFSYNFVGKSRVHPFQTWYKATGNTSIGDTTTDSGHKLHVIGTTKSDGLLTALVGADIRGGYGPTTNLSDATLLQIGAAGSSGGNAVSMAWGDGTGYKMNFGPVIAGTFTPKAYIEDTGNMGMRYGASTGTTFGSITTPANGAWVWCSDCVVASTCAGSGTGAFAFRSGGTWKCPF